jgi:probable rRNA maturation factor
MSEEPPSPSAEIAVVVQDSAWCEALREAAEVARRAARAALRQQYGVRARSAEPDAPRAEPAMGASELTVVLADDRLLRRLNREYRGQDRATNVLSFAGLEGPSELRPEVPRLLGDVVLARETVFREARAQNKPPGEHLSHLVVHGVLHLLGFDHETEAQAESMEAVECAVLAGLGISDPYGVRQAPCPARGGPGSCDD